MWIVVCIEIENRSSKQDTGHNGISSTGSKLTPKRACFENACLASCSEGDLQSLKSIQYVRSFHKRTIVLVSWTSKDILIIFGECCTRMGSLVLWSCRQSRGLSRAVVPVLAHFLQESPPSPLFNLDSAVQMSPSNQSSWMLNAGWRVKGKSNTVKSGLAWIWVQCYSVRTAQPPSTFGTLKKCLTFGIFCWTRGVWPSLQICIPVFFTNFFLSAKQGNFTG